MNGQTDRNKSFECSHRLDSNSLQALQHDDDEDQVHHATTAYLNKQKARQENLKNLKGATETCVVCGDVASGIWYSVWACNGCKTFFRRVVIENRTYSCKRNGNCRIDKNMRCSCRHCRFRKCLKVGMDCAELNIERRRKKRCADVKNPITQPDNIGDKLIRELVTREREFLKILTSTNAPIHASIREGLLNQSIFKNFQTYERNQMRPCDQMNFSYWRAKILSTVIEWAKSFDEFTQLSFEDQQALIVHASFSNLVLSEAFHTPERYTDRIVFPDGLSGFRNLTANILKERSGLIPTVVAVINGILVPIRRMRMTEIEYVLLQAIIFFDPAKIAISALLLRIPNVHKVAAFKRETLCTIETFNLMSPHPLTMEISKKYPDISFF
ncbi:zinc finger, c4 type (two domains) domain-containing protein [Ditylenchus destructor]|uniref:Zinc finger, c4 type (Two domains) domain-containing protein n=1 Tax=Ditylenchus destructor TaxID=166010 RepID=A0AAD4R893_9BILA|nr:zinc finger, c4 type (two domains) domain-containing protein [Ditylenchus destructor]